ncbi:hypothetical protein [Silvibacterium sp.]|uniref:hypothetical protein n=1 Tax=Silvibacterium sp. TaxID=1964179 RepID=UPI0039E27AE1
MAEAVRRGLLLTGGVSKFRTADRGDKNMVVMTEAGFSPMHFYFFEALTFYI